MSNAHRVDGTQQQRMQYLPITGGDLIIEGYGWKFLEYFRFQTIPIFSTYYDTTLWEVMLAQTSVSQAPLQYTAVAFAATHHEYESRRRGSTKRLDVTSPESAVAMLYIDAVSKARQALAEASSTAEAVRTGFIISFMLAATESLRNSMEGVTMHLANGLKIAFSQGYETTTTSWKPCESGLALKDAVLAFIEKLIVVIDEELAADLEDYRRTQPVTTARPSRYSLCDIYHCISSVVEHPEAWLGLSNGFVHFETLEASSQRLRHLTLRAIRTERRKLRFLRLYREAAHLLLLCHMNDFYSTESSHSHVPTSSDSRSDYLKAYLSKLSMIEEQLRDNNTFITHLTPAQLNRFAARYSVICSPSLSHPLCSTEDPTSLQTLYGEVEQLVMLEEDAIMATGLVPADATCMEVTSALERGSVSIRYCIVRSGGTSFEWVEKKATLWKPAVFKQHQVN
ncbi:hypothetical protein TCE0_034r11537 [Talaromyces pinophilus]|uniref:Uncharacterized protein n=1 Tax=Talaromyces pinophilus TaxID=128442 RepID=A0A6V8HEK8_TALPI|nr:hypothetical protein TCE0_034r11537 [Talaromyces pinophilus]